MTTVRTRLTGLAALAGLLLVLAGTPAVLIAIGATPFPDGIPTWDQAWATLTGVDDGTVVLTLLRLVAWGAWAYLALGVVLELAWRARGIRVPRIRGLALSQSTAHALVSAAVLAFTALPSLAAPASAATPVAVTSTLPGPPAAAATEHATATSTGVGGATTTVVEDATAVTVHTVRPGETLWGIAEQHLGDGARFLQIAEVNYARPQPDGRTLTTSHRIHPGWQLLIPTAGPAAADVTPDAGVSEYTVAPGDTLWDIADDELDDPTRYGEIFTASVGITQPGGHHLSDPDEISPGWTLHIPTGEPPTTDPVEAAAPAVEMPGVVPAEPPPTAADEPEQGAEAPDGVTPLQVPAPAVVADANAVEDIDSSEVGDGVVEDVAEWPVRTTTGVGSLLAAGLVGLLATRRALQARRRRPGLALPMPTGPSAAAETELRVVADPFGVAAVDTALRTLARSCAQHGQPLPSLRYARLTAGQFDLHLAEPALLPEPWTGTADATVWTLHVEEADLLDAQAAADIPAPYPALVTLGHDSDDAHIFVDLEHVGSLALIGEEDRSDAVLAALALELATSAWADHLQVTIVAAFPELEDALRTGRIRYLPSAGLLFDELTARAENDRAALAEAGALDLAHARTTNAAPEAWFPQIVLLATPLTARQRGQLTALLDGLPRVAVAAVTTGPGVGEWAVTLTEPGEDAVLDPLGLRLRPQRIDPAGYRAILDVAALTGIDPTEPYPTGHHDATYSGAHHPAGHAGDHPADLTDDGEHDDDTAPSESPQGSGQGPNPGPRDAGQGGDTAADLGGQVVGQGANPVPRDAGQGGDTALDLGGQVVGQGPDGPADGGGQGPRRAPEPRRQAGDADALGEAGRDGVGVEDQPELAAPAAVEVVEAAGDRAAPFIRLLGAVVVENTRGHVDVPHKGRALELAAFLALRPGASSTAMQEALWPGSSSESTRYSMTSKFRGWLGEDSAKEAYFPKYAPSTGYVLHPAVRSDWGLWCDLLPDGPLAAPTERLEQALDLVRGRPFENAAAKTYTWAERDRALMIAQIADAAGELARRRGEAGDWRGAEDAALRGLAIDPALERLWRVRILAAHAGGSPHAGQEAIDRMLTIAAQLGGDLEAETTALLAGLRTDTDPRILLAVAL